MIDPVRLGMAGEKNSNHCEAARLVPASSILVGGENLRLLGWDHLGEDHHIDGTLSTRTCSAVNLLVFDACKRKHWKINHDKPVASLLGTLKRGTHRLA